MELILKAAIQEWLGYNGETLMIRLGLYKKGHQTVCSLLSWPQEESLLKISTLEMNAEEVAITEIRLGYAHFRKDCCPVPRFTVLL